MHFSGLGTYMDNRLLSMDIFCPSLLLFHWHLVLGLGSNYYPLTLTLTLTLTLNLNLTRIVHEMYIVHVIYPKISHCPWKSRPHFLTISMIITSQIAFETFILKKNNWHVFVCLSVCLSVYVLYVQPSW